MKKTFGELLLINNAISEIQTKNSNLEMNKFGYACKRFIEKSLRPVFQEKNYLKELARIENALEDKNTGEILFENGSPKQFKFSREGLKKCYEDEWKIEQDFNKKTFEVVPFICEEEPKELTDIQREILKGIIIK